MEEPLTLLAVFILAFVIGGTPFGYLAGRMRGVDIREHGSGNIGATNVIRVLGKKIGVPVFILDVLKGLVPVLLARWLCPANEYAPILAALGAILGHNYTFWLKFKGGKGVATSAGALLGLMWLPLVIGTAVWYATFRLTRYVAVASIAAALSLPTVSGILVAYGQKSWPLFIFSLVISTLAIWRHRSNIRRICAGTEHQFQPRPKQQY